MRKIAVEVEQLESCAARMEEKNQDYLHNFRQLHLLASQYIDFLRNSARSYRNTQQELTSMINALGGK